MLAILQANLTATGLKWLLISRKLGGFMGFKTIWSFLSCGRGVVSGCG